MTTTYQSVVVEAIPPEPPPLSLLAASKAMEPPDATTDPSSSSPDPDHLAEMPADLVAELRERHSDEMWVRGIRWAPESHRKALVRDPCDTETVIERAENLPIRECLPFLIIAEDGCSAFGFEARDFQGRATRLLDNSKFEAIEHEFFTGTQASASGWPNDYLTNPATVEDLTPGAGAPTIERGFQILQDALAECGFGGRGMLHVQRQTATNYLTVHDNEPHFLVKDDTMYDLFGNIIVPGVGYTGFGPENAEPAEGKAWIYATDLVVVREEPKATIFPATFAEAMDWGQHGDEGEPNTIRFQAQKLALYQWDGACHFACEVTLA